MHTHLSTPCLNIALSMSGRQSESWVYFYFIVWNMWTQYKLVYFRGPVTLLHLFLVSWFKKIIIFPWEGYKYAGKLLNQFLISQKIYVYLLQFNLLFLYNLCTTLFITVYIKYHKIICASYRQLTSFLKGLNY